MAADKSVFLWGGPPPLPDVTGFNPRSDKWWTQYQTSLNISPVALRELAKSSRDIAAIIPDPMNWGSQPHPYKGLVVGAVQSGKTGSMMGVAAVALDQGYRIIIVLAGLKDDLRQQTARRFNSQLLRQSDAIPDGNEATTLGTPRGSGPLGGFAPPYQLDANQFSLLQLRMQKALNNGEPCIIVVKKNVASLRDLQSALQHLYTTFGVESLPTLIFDDECDDASVDSTDTTIPAAIANLWRRPGAEQPLAVYLGYTATSAANLLQHPSNELYPEHSAYLLRYPGDEDTAIQFFEPNPDSWYSGGECYYRTFGEETGEEGNFLVSATVDAAHLAVPIELNPSLVDALRAYLVAGAYRLAAEPSRNFTTPEAWPRSHSMLVQTSADIDEHSRWAKAISNAFDGRILADRSIAFDPARLSDLVSTDEAGWRKWYDNIESSRERIYADRPHPGVQRAVSWAQVRAKLPDVFEHTRLKVVNSDVSIGSSLDYAARRLANGVVLPPQDTYVIVVGGSKLSRGLTLEGLSVSYFVRWPLNPTEDTVLQMSRWFGYRGPHLEYCRVFTTPVIAENLRQMHENDVDLRFQLSQLMEEKKSPREATLIIRANPRAQPTNKMGIGVTVDLSYSPFTNVLRAVEVGPLAKENEDAARKLADTVRTRNGKKVLTLSRNQRGILSRDWSAREIADLLDSFQFSDHNPDHDGNLLKEYYRYPSLDRPVASSLTLVEDPYQIAAYLRAWAEQSEKLGKTPPPSFNVGVAHGEMNAHTAPFDFALVNRQVTEDDRVVGGWTGRSPSWDGDAFFDQPPARFRAKGSQQRLEGADGLLLLYVIHKDATGHSGRGKQRCYHTPMFAISIPAGGPPFRRVVVEGKSENN